MKKILFAALTCSLVLSLAPVAMAACNPSLPNGCAVPDQNILTNGNTDGLSGGVALVVKITNWMFTLLLVLAVLFIIMAAFKYMFSGGSEEAVGAAHKMLIYAVVAIAVAFLAKGIVFVVQELVGAGSGSGGSGVSAGCSLQYVNGSLQYVCNGSVGGSF